MCGNSARSIVRVRNLLITASDQYRPFNSEAVNGWFYQFLSFVERLAVYRNERLFILID